MPLRESGALKGASHQEIAAFRTDLENFQQEISATSTTLENKLKLVNAMQTALSRASKDSEDLVTRIYNAKQQLLDLDIKVNGNDTKDEVGERSNPTPRNRMSVGFRALRTTYGPTAMHKESMEIGKKQLSEIKSELKQITDTVLPGIESDLKALGAPWIEGQVY